MILSNLKKAAAAFHQTSVASMTSADSLDMFLVAANNAKNNAQLLHNFELSRVQATLDIDGVTGGTISDAVIVGSSSLIVTSTAAAGTYVKKGTFASYAFYILEGATTYFLYYNTATTSYVIATTLTTGALTNYWLPATDITIPTGSYVGQGSVSGTAVVTRSTTTAWSGLKEIIAIQRSNADGLLVPLDFTSPSVVIERDRYELEMSEEYEPYRRYPSDAALLDRGSNGSLIQRGGTLFVYPQATSTATPFSVTIEGYGALADYTASNLNDTGATDFLVEHGSVYLQWAIICELNYYFSTFVPRQEGVLSPPEQRKEEAWNDLLLWDSYLVDNNSTRSR